jgi:hypothetical protein
MKLYYIQNIAYMVLVSMLGFFQFPKNWEKTASVGEDARSERKKEKPKASKK